MKVTELIEEYKSLPEYCYNIDYLDKAAIKKMTVSKIYRHLEQSLAEYTVEGDISPWSI